MPILDFFAADYLIATPRLILRAPQEQDVEAITEGLSNPAVTMMLARVPFPYHRPDADEWLQRSHDRRQAGTGVVLAVFHSDAFIGVVGMDRFDHAKKTPNLGYWFRQSAWGRGFATEAAGTLVAATFRETHVPAIRSGAFAENIASLRVQEKLGFVAIGSGLMANVARGVDANHVDTLLTRGRHQDGLREQRWD